MLNATQLGSPGAGMADGLPPDVAVGNGSGRIDAQPQPLTVTNGHGTVTSNGRLNQDQPVIPRPDADLGLNIEKTLSILEQDGEMDVAELMKLLHGIMALMRKVTRESRATVREEIDAEAQNIVSKILDQANKEFRGAQIMAAVTIGMGALSVGGSIQGLRGIRGSMKASKLASTSVKLKGLQGKLKGMRSQVKHWNKQAQLATGRLDRAQKSLVATRSQFKGLRGAALKAKRGLASRQLQQVKSAAADLKKIKSQLASANMHLRKADADFRAFTSKHKISSADINRVEKTSNSNLMKAQDRAAGNLQLTIQRSQQVIAGVGGLSQAGTGAGQMGQAQYQLEAREAEKDRTLHEAEKAKAEAVYQDDTELMATFQEALRDVREKLRTIIQTQHDTSQSILRI